MKRWVADRGFRGFHGGESYAILVAAPLNFHHVICCLIANLDLMHP